MKKPKSDNEKKVDLEPDHADWLVKHRAATQVTSGKLYRLLKEYERECDGLGLTVQSLVAVAFSLWRSAFLSDKTGYREDTFKGGVKFMSEMLQNNAINYPQERGSKDWTFTYYANNARYRLEELKEKHQSWGIGVTKPKDDTPKIRWEFLQRAFEQAVDGFELHLKRKKSGK